MAFELDDLPWTFPLPAIFSGTEGEYATMGCDSLTEYRVSEDESYCVAIIRAMARAHSIDPTSLPTFYEVIDPDALESVLRTLSSPSDEEGMVVFEYDGHVIRVDETKIRVSPA